MKRMFTPLVGALAFASATVAMANSTDQLIPESKLRPAPEKIQKNVYVVRLRDKAILDYAGGIAGLAATQPKAGEKVDPQDADVRKYSAHIEQAHQDVLQSVGAGENEKVYSYRYATNGFAAKLTAEQVESLKSNSNVLAIYKDELLQIQTDSTPQFLGLTEKGGAWLGGYTGEDVVVGVLDTGINPEHPSFADVPTPFLGSVGKPTAYGPAPSTWVGTGCEFGNTAFNPADVAFDCNNKLLKAEYFVDGFGVSSLADGEFLSARDSDGHGSHTAATAAGNWGVPATIAGESRGDVSGVAPRARIAAYKVCWEGVNGGGCAASDSMAAIDQAVADGVDVINYSIGGSSTSFGSPDNISFLLAAASGVWVATSQGNAGPAAGTTGTPAGAPWITAVGATQDDQVFATGVDVTAPLAIAGEYIALEGSGAVTLAGVGTIADEIVPVIPAEACTDITNAADVDGKIALVIRGSCAFTAKYEAAAAAGARAIIVYNHGNGAEGEDPIYMGGFDGSETIPGVMISNSAGVVMASAAAAGSDVTGSLSPDIQISQANRIASFSSRGPNGGAPDIIKPDIAAPGVQILAAVSQSETSNATFGLLSGTSMASPHVAGVFALLKQAHPDWSAAMARSALMTTARQDIKKTFGEAVADPFDIGAGHIVPNDAFEPGLVYDLGLLDYVAFSCDNNVQLIEEETCGVMEFLGYSKDASDLNLPSIAIADLTGVQATRRTVTSVADGEATYTVDFEAPEGVEMVVWPQTLVLEKGESALYNVAFVAKEDAVMDEWAFGSLTWRSNKGAVARSPVAVRPVNLYAPPSVDLTGTEGSSDFDVVFGYEGEFSASIEGLAAGNVVGNEIDDNGFNQEVVIIPPGTSFARFAMYAEEVGDGTGSDDLDIQVFGPQSEGFPFQGASATASSEESVDLENPAPGLYVVVVADFASAEGPTSYNLYDYAITGDAGNATITGSDEAVLGAVGRMSISWSDLLPASRYLGFINYTGERGASLGQSEVNVNTQ